MRFTKGRGGWKAAAPFFVSTAYPSFPRRRESIKAASDGNSPHPRERQPCVYILASGKHGTLYIGVTSDLPARLRQHREHLIEGFTSRYGVTRLVYFEMADDMLTAITREKQLKKWRRT